MQLQVNSISDQYLNHFASKTQDVILLHGLFGNLSNWKKTAQHFSPKHRVLIPELPLFDHFIGGNHLDKLVVFLENYIAIHHVHQPVLIGNSLGGHVALLYTLKHPDKVSKLVLAGSSGLYENTFGGSFPRVKDYNYIKEKVADVFDRKEVVDNEMIDHVFGIVQHKLKVLSIIGLARDAQRQNLAAYLPLIKIPVLLIWGLQDKVTPPAVGEEFKQLLADATLHYLDECGHAPMMEQPELFNGFVAEFLAA
ncbi:MAG: alpha/beta hydrolase [Pedobacter sp.]|nr:MAG: alpha/beta hydrolase [Pedobacter sp.]